MQRATHRWRAVLPWWASAVVGGWCKGGGLHCGICGGGCSGCKGGGGWHKDIGLHCDGGCNGGVAAVAAVAVAALAAAVAGQLLLRWWRAV